MMFLQDPAVLSLLALLLIIIVAGSKESLVGVLSLGLAALLGLTVAGMEFPEIILIFPFHLFKVLIGVTLFFGIAKANGALDHAAALVLKGAHGRPVTLPLYFFAGAFILAAIGAGNIGAVAILAPLAMSAGKKSGISPFFIAVMLVNGANAGTFSPLSPTGLIVAQSTVRIGLHMDPWGQVFLPSLLAQSFIALAWYLVLAPQTHRRIASLTELHEPKPRASLNKAQKITLSAMPAFLIGITFFRFDTGALALLLSGVLILCQVVPLKSVARTVPWTVVGMVCGVSTLVGVVEKMGGLDLFTSFLVRASSAGTVTAVLAGVTGIVSTFSSSSGVVLPAFIPLVPGIIAKLGGGDPASLVASINVGSHVVDLSPLSTLGALCLASAHTDKKTLFRKLMVYGLSMSVFGAGVCYLFFSNPWVIK